MTEKSVVCNSAPLIAQKRESFFEFFYLSVLIVYSGHANRFVAAGSNLGNPIWFLIPVVLAFFLMIKRRVPFNWQFYLLIVCFLIYFFAITIKYGDLRPRFFLNYFLIFFRSITKKTISQKYYKEPETS